MINQTAYDTTACRGFLTSKLFDALDRTRIDHYLTPDNDGFENVYAVSRTAYLAEAVPPFVYPVYNEDDNGINPRVYFDARPYMRATSEASQISNQPGYSAARAMAVMTLAWKTTPIRYMRNLSTVPLTAYCHWIGDNISKRLALEPQDQLSIVVLAGVFYLNQFMASSERTTLEKVEMVSMISKATKIKASQVQDVVNDRARIDNLDDFCEICKDYTGVTRLRDLNVATLIGIVGGTWYGANSRELVAVALEYPPIWMVMLYQAINDRSYHHSGITKMMERGAMKREGANYSRALSDYLGGFKKTNSGDSFNISQRNETQPTAA